MEAKKVGLIGTIQNEICDIAIKTDSKPVTAQLGDGALADQKLPGGAADGDFVLQMAFHIFQQFIQQLILLRGGKFSIAEKSSVQKGKQKGGISVESSLPAGVTPFGFGAASSESLPNGFFPTSSSGSQQIAALPEMAGKVNFQPLPVELLQKLRVNPNHDSLIGFVHYFRKQRPMADAGGG